MNDDDFAYNVCLSIMINFYLELLISTKTCKSIIDAEFNGERER